MDIERQWITMISYFSVLVVCANFHWCQTTSNTCVRIMLTVSKRLPDLQTSPRRCYKEQAHAVVLRTWTISGSNPCAGPGCDIVSSIGDLTTGQQHLDRRIDMMVGHRNGITAVLSWTYTFDHDQTDKHKHIATWQSELLLDRRVLFPNRSDRSYGSHLPRQD